MMLLALSGGLFISYYNGNIQVDTSLFSIVIPMLLVIMFFGLRRGINRQKNIYQSYRLTLDEQTIIRQQNMTPDIVLPISEIKEILKNKDGSLSIRGKGMNNSIGVPSQLDNIEELEGRLSEIMEIQLKDQKSFIQKFPWLMPILMLGLMVTVYISDNKLLVGFSGITLTIGLIYSMIYVQRSKHVDKKTKRTTWLVLVVLFSIMVVTFIKVFMN